MDWTALDYEKIANAIVILVVGLAAGLGLRSGSKKAASGHGATVEVAGALIDGSTANGLKAAIEGHTQEMLNFRKSTERAGDRLTEAIKDLTNEVEALKMEVVRKHH